LFFSDFRQAGIRNFALEINFPLDETVILSDKF
jgi:hypothetical protein